MLTEYECYVAISQAFVLVVVPTLVGYFGYRYVKIHKIIGDNS